MFPLAEEKNERLAVHTAKKPDCVIQTRSHKKGGNLFPSVSYFLHNMTHIKKQQQPPTFRTKLTFVQFDVVLALR